MIRVAHILPFMGVGGTEQMVLSMCKFRNREEFDYVVSAPEEGVITGEIQETGATVYTGNTSCYTAMQLADLVNMHWTRYNPHFHLLLQTSGKPYVTTLHWASEMPVLNFTTICTSYYAYQLQKDKSRFVAIPNGVDLSRFSPRPRKEREEVIIARVCRPPKCALYFWKAMNKVLERYPQTRLWIVGNDKDAVWNSEQVRFFGIRRDIPEILAEADIFAYTPYPNEGSKDLVVMEALAMGLPCVVSDVNAVNESVEDGQNGFLTPFGDIDAFSQKIGLLVEDEELRARMSQNAVKIAQERFDMRRITRHYEDIYKTTLCAYQNFKEMEGHGT